MGALSVVRQAYAEAYRPLYACVLRFAAAQLRGDLEAADEVATETLGRGWLRITSFRAEDRPQHADSRSGNLRAWLLRIARNACVDVARRRGMTVPLFDEPMAGAGLANRQEDGDETVFADEPASSISTGAAASLGPEQLLRRLEEVLAQLQPIVEQLADALPTFPGGRGRPTRSQQLSVAVRDLRVGCDKTLEAFRNACTR
jgi:DNA-directed RNA polymerase specialized sigma24 family protein